MAVVFDANATAPAQSGAVTQGTNVDTSALTIGAALVNGALVAQLAFSTLALTGVTVTWDPAGTNQSLTLIGTANSAATFGRVELWGLCGPTAGAKVLRVHWTGGGSSDVAVNGVSWSGVDPSGGTTSFGNFTSATGTSTAQSVTATSASGDAAMEVGANDTNVYNAHGQTLTFEADTLADIGAEGQRSLSVSPTFTATIASSGHWVACACSVRAFVAPGVPDSNKTIARQQFARRPGPFQPCGDGFSRTRFN